MESSPNEMHTQETRRPNPDQLLTVPPLKDTLLSLDRLSDLKHLATDLAEKNPNEFGAYNVFQHDEKPWTVDEIIRVLTEPPSDLYTIVEGASYLVNYVVQNNVDTVFFLDKSARSTAFAFRKIWQLAYPDAPYPNIRFINIPKELSDHESEFENQENYQKMVDEAVASVRHEYPSHNGDKPLGKMVVADEWIIYGKAARAAVDVVARAFDVPVDQVEYTGLHENEVLLNEHPEFAGVKEHGETEWQEPIREWKKNLLPGRSVGLSSFGLNDIDKDDFTLKDKEFDILSERGYAESYQSKEKPFEEATQTIREGMISERVEDAEYRQMFIANRRAVSLAILAIFGRNGENIHFLPHSPGSFVPRDQYFYDVLNDKMANDYDVDDYDDLL